MSTILRSAPDSEAQISATVTAPSQPLLAYTLAPPDVLDRLGAHELGWSDAEAQEQRARVGPNVLPAEKPRSAWRILGAQLRSVVVLLLVVAATAALLQRDVLDAAAIGGVLLINVVLGFITELRARRAVDALRRLEVPRATVLRDGVTRDIDARNLVPGDVVEVEEGQSVPADARLLTAVDLHVNESALTGESLPVSKHANKLLSPDTPLAERVNMVYKATAVATGHARAVVVATGSSTEVGRIGLLLSSVREERAPLERRLDELARRLIWVALGVALLISLIALLQGATTGEVIQTGIALAIAAFPEGLPAVATITLAVGVRRMARRRAIVRRLPAVETLGSATVICTDKTGTLTTSQMTATVLWVGGEEYALDGDRRDGEHGSLDIEALQIAALANRAEAVEENGRLRTHGDPTEVALLLAARRAGVDRERLRSEWPEVGEVPFSSERMLMATFHRHPGGELRALVKGAPGRLTSLCTHELTPDGETPVDDTRRRALLEQNEQLAGRGLRVLALARGAVREPGEEALTALTFVGFVGLIDPPAAGVEETIHRFRDAGIRTVMITGDQRLTAAAIARQLGILATDEEVVDGRELHHLGDDQLSARMRRVGALSRVSPADKLRIVDLFQREHEVVAMLGDGVNDAPALRKADIGVAMGGRGTDVAKEAAVLVLQDDRFATIGAAVEEGRVVLGNIRKFVWYLFSCNLAEVLALLGAGVTGMPLPLLPLQILWLNLVTDTFPALALAFEPAESNLMRRPPQDPRSPILPRAMLGSAVAFAVLITICTLAAFAWGLRSPGGASYAVTLSFLTLGIAQTLHLGNARSTAAVVRRGNILSNPYATGAVVLTIALLLLTVYFEPLARVLGTRPPAPRDWAIIVGLAVIPAIVGQAWKLRRPKTELNTDDGLRNAEYGP